VTSRASNLGARRREESPPVAPSRERLGLSFTLLLVWLWFEYGRPTYPLGIPLLISATLLVVWLRKKDKRWSRQSTLFMVFLGVMAVGIPLAVNTFSAFWSVYGMVTVLVCTCLPLQSLVTSVRKVRVWIYTFVAVAFYVAVWAVFNNGYGPAAAGGGQDENYVAAMMGMATSFAYFSIFAAKRLITKLMLSLSMVVFLGAVIAGQDVARGGFLGLCAVFLYCLVRSPRRWIGFIVILVILTIGISLTGSRYWDEIRTISDVDVGTADMRIDIWKVGMRMWASNPILGVGAGNFRWMVGRYQSSEQLEKYGRDLGGSIIAHSLFVELLAELGIIGALVLLLLLYHAWHELRQVIQKRQYRRDGSVRSDNLIAIRCYADAVMCGILCCLVNGVFLSLLYYSYLWVFLALGSAIVRVWRSEVRLTA
jgi:O-antigen ligase